MKTTENPSRGFRGRCLLALGLGLFGAFFLVAGLVRPDLAWIFGILGFASFVVGAARALACWNVDSLVFDDHQPRAVHAGRSRAA